jgi:hypothetical protein
MIARKVWYMVTVGLMHRNALQLVCQEHKGGEMKELDFTNTNFLSNERYDELRKELKLLQSRHMLPRNWKRYKDTNYWVTDGGCVLYSEKDFTLDKNGYTKFCCSGRTLTFFMGTNGVYVKALNDKAYDVHRLVAETFLPIKDTNGLQVHHKDNNAYNNSVYNLQWVTRAEHDEIHNKTVSPFNTKNENWTRYIRRDIGTGEVEGTNYWVARSGAVIYSKEDLPESIPSADYVKCLPHNTRYGCVSVRVEGDDEYYVCDLVAETFKPIPEIDSMDYLKFRLTFTPYHIDGNLNNNSVANLVWVRRDKIGADAEILCSKCKASVEVTE